ncbi:MAG: sodium/sugar symporter [Saprospiraceae bacterium]|nr:sodium/sugar symporter [Saprospiraceae bacterium]MCF8250148.1 sodium/sugar symporter [Saprospiraceae bacterium]MCF8279411.1 sodium/sugar symporter [Bacteroidales bacterium]MCF8311202.1 sodium/sugar symporter [Saprospiraceae bacterium]MCF8440418.1 sodium/sugar symporter [Saprospiraceae bacterium]
MDFGTLDYVVFIGYAALIMFIGLWVSRKGEKTAEGYFLASKSLPWWAIGSSLIAANISAEQFIGMSGSGFAIGLAIASYEWMAALSLLIVGKFFLPIFIKQQLYTIPEFVEKRYSTNLKTILAIFWICLFVFVNLTSVLYLGAKALDTILGSGDGSTMMYFVVGLALFAAAYSLWGGLSAVAWTDVVQVILLVIGGLVTTFIAITHISPDGGIISGFQTLYEKVPEKFSMILEQGEIITPNGKDAWWDLPGLAVLLGGMWVANLYYWGFNQYIIQRTLAAKSLREAQKGIAFAAFLKLLMPLIVVVPGIIAYVLNSGPDGLVTAQSVDPAFLSNGAIINDSAAPWLIHKFVPTGLKGLVLAALAAAIVSSLASMLNSTATIFTMDIYKPYFGKNAEGGKLVNVGRITAVVALVISIILAPQLGNLGQVFQYIQEYTGIVSPGILAVFMLGLFWKKTTNNAAIWGVLLSIPIAMYFKVAPNEWSDSSFFVHIPFLQQMMWTWVASSLIMVAISYIEGKGADHEKGIPLTRQFFATSPAFNISAFIVCLILVFLYAMFW